MPMDSLATVDNDAVTSSKMAAMATVTSQDGDRCLATVAKEAMMASKMADMATVTSQDSGRCQGLAMG